MTMDTAVFMYLPRRDTLVVEAPIMCVLIVVRCVVFLQHSMKMEKNLFPLGVSIRAKIQSLNMRQKIGKYCPSYK